MKPLALLVLIALGAVAALAGLRPIWHGGVAGAPAPMETAIHDYLMKNPQVILASLKSLSRHEERAEQDDTLMGLTEYNKQLRGLDGDPVAGNPRGDVTVVEFFDYRCPYCKHAHETVRRLLQSDPNVRVVYKEFPILSPGSVLAAKAALAARAQGKYLDLHNVLMTAQGDYSEEMVLAAASQAGLNIAQLKSDMKNPALVDELRRTQAMARELSINGTPTFIIGDHVTSGALELDEMLSQIKAAREKCESCKG